MSYSSSWSELVAEQEQELGVWFLTLCWNHYAQYSSKSDTLIPRCLEIPKFLMVGVCLFFIWMLVSLQDLSSLMLALLTGSNPELRSKPQYGLCHLLPALKRLSPVIPLWSTWSSLHFPEETSALWPFSYKRYFLAYSLAVRKTQIGKSLGWWRNVRSVTPICSHSLHS